MVAKEYREAEERDVLMPGFLTACAVVDDCINYAFLRNQELRASFEQWSASIEATRSAGYYDEPQSKLRRAKQSFSDLTKVQVEIDMLKNEFDTLRDGRVTPHW